MIPPSRRLHKHLKVVTSENEYLKDAQKRKQYLDGIKTAMESPFGVILLKSLENIERSGHEALYGASLKSTEQQARAEIKTARYLTAVLMGYVYEADALEAAINTYNEMEVGDVENDYQN